MARPKLPQLNEGTKSSRRKSLRKYSMRYPTNTESELWTYLNQWKTGYQFVREVDIGAFRVDFACFPLNLAIEVDGGYHTTKEQMNRDEVRQAIIELKGWTFLRFTVDDVKGNGKRISSEISAHCDNLCKERGINIVRYRQGKSPCGRVK